MASEAPQTDAYGNVLQLIQSLRLFCDVGLHYHTRYDKSLPSRLNADDWAAVAQQTFNFQREIVPIICLQCSSVLEMIETAFDDSTTAQPTALFSSCLKFVCRDCTHKFDQASSTATCGHNPSCPIAPVSTRISVEEGSNLPYPQTRPLFTSLPSKVQALVSDLKTLPLHVKWYFSNTLE